MTIFVSFPLQIEKDDSWSDPVAKIVVVIGSAHYRATYLKPDELVTNTDEPATNFWSFCGINRLNVEIHKLHALHRNGPSQ